MNIRSVAVTLSVAGMLSLSTVGYGDDTDIYLGVNPVIVAEPQVMLTLDMKANNLSSAFCTYAFVTGDDPANPASPDDCFAKLGPEIYPFMVAADSTFGLNYTANGVTRFDAFRALHATLYDDLEGVQIGFMLSHNEQTGEGGYILRRFRSFQAGDANGAKAELITKLYSIPNPGGATAVSPTPTPIPVATPTPVACTGTSATDTMSITDQGQTLNFSISDVLANEGTNASFSIQVSGTVKKNNSVTLNWSTANGTATTSTGDYTSVASSKTYTAGGSNMSVSETIVVNVPVINDGLSEPTSETFLLNLSGGGDSASATATICDAGGSGGGTADFSISDVTVNEGQTANFTVIRGGDTATAVDVDYSTVDGTAISGTDYTGATGVTLNFASGEISKTVAIATIADVDLIGPEDFTVVLSNPTGSSTLVDDTGVGTILEAGACAAGGSYDHKYQGAEMYFEFARYLTGGPVLTAHDGQGDWGSDPSTNLDTECYAPGGTGTLSWDAAAEDGAGNYVSPLLASNACAKVFAVNMMFGVSNQDNTHNSAIGQSKTNHGLGETPSNSNAFADMIRILDGMDLGSDEFPNWDASNLPPDGVQNVTTYILRFDGPAGQFAPYAAAGANVIDADQDDLQAALDDLRRVFDQILSVSTTFVSASVPVDVFNRAAVNENVFIALFETDQNNRPSWNGNLKKLKIRSDDVAGFVLHDALTTTSAIDPSDGRIADVVVKAS